MEPTDTIPQNMDNLIIPYPVESLSRTEDNAFQSVMGRVSWTCMLYFRGGHLPEIQARVCECVQEYTQLVGKNIKSCKTLDNRLALIHKRNLPPMTLEGVQELQARGKAIANYTLSSNDTRKSYTNFPASFFLRAALCIDGKRNSYPPLDKRVSILFASFLPSFFKNTSTIQFKDIVTKWCNTLQPLHGSAGWGIVCPVENSLDYEVSGPHNLSTLDYNLKHPCLDTFFPHTYSEQFTYNIASINWLTVLHDDFVERIGGAATLSTLGDECTVSAYSGGYTIQAGPRPEIGDKDKLDVPQAYRNVQECLLPLYRPIKPRESSYESFFRPSDCSLPATPRYEQWLQRLYSARSREYNSEEMHELMLNLRQAGNSFYTIIDKSTFADADKIFRLFDDMQHIPLFSTTTAASPDATGPMLVMIPAHSTFLQEYCSESYKDFPCALFASGKPVNMVKDFFASRLHMQRPSGERFAFNFYEARTMLSLLRTLSAQRQQDFFGPVRAVLFSVQDIRHGVHRHGCEFLSISDAKLASFLQNISLDEHPCWKLTDEEWKRFQEFCDAHVLLIDVLRLLLDKDPVVFKNHNDAYIIEKVRKALELGRSYGMELHQDLQAFAEMVLVTYPGIQLSPKAIAYFQQPVQPFCSKIAALPAPDDPFWEEIAQLSKLYLGFYQSGESNENTIVKLLKKRNCPYIIDEEKEKAYQAEWLLANQETQQRKEAFEHSRHCCMNPSIDVAAHMDEFVIHSPYWMRQWGINQIVGRVGLTCMFFFKGGHIPEVQEKICECVQDYVELVGENAKSSRISGGRRVFAKKTGLNLITVEKIQQMRERKERKAYHIISSCHSSVACNRNPPAYSLCTVFPLEPLRGPETCLYAKSIQLGLFCAGFAPSHFTVKTQKVSFQQLIRKWCEALQPIHGSAGWGVQLPDNWEREFTYKTAISPYLMRYPGLDIPYISRLSLTDSLFDHLASINWLTIVNNEFADRIGGLAALSTLGEDCPVSTYPGGYMIQAGPRPEIGHREQGEIPQAYGKVQELLLPLYAPIENIYHIAPSQDPLYAAPDYLPHEYTSTEERIAFNKQWLRRFE